MHARNVIFENCGLKKMIVKDGVTGELIYYGEREKRGKEDEN